MVKTVSILTDVRTYLNVHVPVKGSKLVIDLNKIPISELQHFDILITFDQPIIAYRNHAYNWCPTNASFIAGDVAPKIIKLANGQLVQSNISLGVWQFNNASPMQLLWRFNPVNSVPLTVFSADGNKKIITPAKNSYNFTTMPALLFCSTAIEISRSEIPFSSIACFTDHCDYDTPANLKLQRQFFKKHHIKVTKGFFMNHFSKRSDNASFENDAAELKLWQQDGHELAYHSLSQSIKPDAKSFQDFAAFLPPFEIPTWIDHGYQPYNLSLFQNKMAAQKYSTILHHKKIKLLWNYIDSGTAALGVINQLNPDDFTLASFSNGIRSNPFSVRSGQLIKNIMFHYYATEKIILAYKNTATDFKKVIIRKQFKKVLSLGRNMLILAKPLATTAIKWNSVKKNPYKLAQYSPILFRHTIESSTFRIFQTIEMIDFKMALHPENLQKLIRESGLFIAHTYFSAPMNYHTGRMFRNPDEIDKFVAENFANLGKLISQKQIWNPTLQQLEAFISKFEQIICDVDDNGHVYLIDSSDVPYRNVI